MKKLSIPEHISLKKEIMPGIGSKELRQLLLAVLPAVAVTVIVWLSAGKPAAQLMALVGLLLYTASCYALFSCPDGRQSIYIFLSRWVRFMRTQQAFKYKQEPEVLRHYGKK